MRLGADHDARHTAAGMIRLWGGELTAHRDGESGLLNNIDPGGATGTRTAQQESPTTDGLSTRGPKSQRERPASQMHPGWMAAQRRAGREPRPFALRTVTTHCFHAQG